MTSFGPVLVTGTSSGIGRATVRELAAQGVTVFAGARRQASLEDLAGEDGDVRPIELDVASPESIDRARSAIGEQLAGGRLRAIVNNAGISGAGPLELVDINEVEQILRVNLLGVLATCQEFLPVLDKPGGRIVNVGSGEGFIVLPINGAYAISKHGLEALSRTLRLELAHTGCHVSVVVPGTTTTPILEHALGQYDDLLAQTGPMEAYRPQIRGRRRLIERGRGVTGPERAARAIARAVAARRPRHHYYLGWDARTPAALAKLPTRLGDRALRWAAR